MSLQPLRISAGRKFAAGLAGIVTTTSTMIGWAFTGLAFLPASPGESLSSRLLFLAVALLTAMTFVVVSHLLVRVALGRHRSGGGLTRFFRYQLAALGCGCGLGLGFLPALSEAAPIWWVASVTAGIGLIAVCLLAFRRARYPILECPPHPNIGLSEGVVVDYWSGVTPRAAAPSLTVVRFTDAAGRARWVRHLVQQRPSMFGTLGQVVYDRHRPDKVRRFAVARPPLDLRPPLAGRHTQPRDDRQHSHPHHRLGEQF